MLRTAMQISSIFSISLLNGGLVCNNLRPATEYGVGNHVQGACQVVQCVLFQSIRCLHRLRCVSSPLSSECWQQVVECVVYLVNHFDAGMAW